MALVNMPDNKCPVTAHINMTSVTQPVEIEKPLHWTYEGETGPEKWGNLSADFKACSSGKRQSPINIITSKASVNPSLSLSAVMFADVGQLLVNDFRNLATGTHNGHAVGLSGIDAFLKYQNSDYKLLQLHFHTPAEHRIDDKLYKAEVHLVHQNAAGRYLVVGALIEDALTSPAYWGPDLLTKFPKSMEESPVKSISINYQDLINGLLGEGQVAYWTYSGSFTTPPCTEEVTFVILKKIAQMSGAHISDLQKATGANNRPVLALNDRTITSPP